jgi:hypothetical protein
MHIRFKETNDDEHKDAIINYIKMNRKDVTKSPGWSLLVAEGKTYEHLIFEILMAL